jgi:hypothetical protein
MDFIATHSTNTLSIITKYLYAEYLYAELRNFYCYAECYSTQCASAVVTSSLPKLSKIAQLNLFKEKP